MIDRELDFILITVDTLRADRLPMYGGERPLCGDPQEPWTMSWLAGHGTVLEDLHAQVGITLPSVSTLWTGQPPLVHGALTNHSKLEAHTFAEALSDHGYEGIGAVANGILGPGSGLGRGFSSYRSFKESKEPRLPGYLLKEAKPIISGKRKLFLWAHFIAPHQPYSPPEKYLGRYSTLGGPKGDNETLYDIHLHPDKLSPQLKEHLRGLYDEEILAANDLSQELLLGLDRAYREAGRGALLDNAVVVFTADHGEELGDRNGFFMHAKSLYSGVTHVPAFILGPGWETAREAHLMGLDDLLPLILFATQPDGSPVISSLKDKFFAIRNEEWTLVHNPSNDESSPGGPPTGSTFPYPTVALFHRTDDPLEFKDLSAERVEQTKAMLDELHRWYLGIQIADSPSSEVDEALLDRLGYVSTGTSTDSSPPPWQGEDWKPSEHE